MRVLTRAAGGTLTVGPRPLGRGGEASVYAAGGGLAAKIYHAPTRDHEQKLRCMIARPPRDPMRPPFRSIAWPVELLHADPGGRVVGFLMPQVTGGRSIGEFFNPLERRKQCPLFDWRYLHQTARNLACAFQALHDHGYVIGDVNDRNIAVTKTALVTLLDTDSFQVPDTDTGAVYRCGVVTPRYTPPELGRAGFGIVDRTPEQDRFGLAVLLFQLLMEGTHPFAGVFHGAGEPAPEEQRIVAGHFPYALRRGPYSPRPGAPPFDGLDRTLQALFQRCFADGDADPSARPDARTWMLALEGARDRLRTCARNRRHLHADHEEACPWCRRALRLGRDPFPDAAPVAHPSAAAGPSPRVRPRPPSWRSAAVGMVLFVLVASVWLWPRGRGAVDAHAVTTPPPAMAVPVATPPDPEASPTAADESGLAAVREAVRGERIARGYGRPDVVPSLVAPPRDTPPSPPVSRLPEETPSLPAPPAVTPAAPTDCGVLAPYLSDLQGADAFLRTLDAVCRGEPGAGGRGDGFIRAARRVPPAGRDSTWVPPPVILGLTPDDYEDYRSLHGCLTSVRGEFKGISCRAAGHPRRFSRVADEVCGHPALRALMEKWRYATQEAARCH